MSETKHSPAPWKYINHNIFDGSNKSIALIGSSDAMVASGEGLANGNLIAAAPDLLKACEAALRYFEECVMSCDPDDEDVEEAAILSAAIAKARSE